MSSLRCQLLIIADIRTDTAVNNFSLQTVNSWVDLQRFSHHASYGVVKSLFSFLLLTSFQGLYFFVVH